MEALKGLGDAAVPVLDDAAHDDALPPAVRAVLAEFLRLTAQDAQDRPWYAQDLSSLRAAAILAEYR